MALGWTDFGDHWAWENGELGKWGIGKMGNWENGEFSVSFFVREIMAGNVLHTIMTRNVLPTICITKSGLMT
jgi:hypothetical protein